MEHVAGKKKGKIILYALSTCQWCEKTKDLLRQLGVDFYYVYVDLEASEEQDKLIGQVEQFNQRGSFPTLVIDDRKSIVGFREGEIREALGS